MDGYQGGAGGLLGAYSRVKARHQRKHAANPNPHRAAQKIALGDVKPDPGPGKAVVTSEELRALFVLQHPDRAVSDEMLQEAMNKCDKDKHGRLRRAELGKALSVLIELTGGERRPALTDAPQPPTCCVVT